MSKMLKKERSKQEEDVKRASLRLVSERIPAVGKWYLEILTDLSHAEKVEFFSRWTTVFRRLNFFC